MGEGVKGFFFEKLVSHLQYSCAKSRLGPDQNTTMDYMAWIMLHL